MRTGCKYWICEGSCCLRAQTPVLINILARVQDNRYRLSPLLICPRKDLLLLCIMKIIKSFPCLGAKVKLSRSSLAYVQDDIYRPFQLLTCICIVINLRFCSYAKLPLSNHHFACMQDHIYLQDRLLTCKSVTIDITICLGAYADLVMMLTADVQCDRYQCRTLLMCSQHIININSCLYARTSIELQLKAFIPYCRQLSAASLFHVKVRAPQITGLPLREPRLDRQLQQKI